MSITDPEELAGMRAAGAIVRRMLEAMKAGRSSRRYYRANSTKSAPPSCASTEANRLRNWSTNFPA